MTAQYLQLLIGKCYRQLKVLLMASSSLYLEINMFFQIEHHNGQ